MTAKVWRLKHIEKRRVLFFFFFRSRNELFYSLANLEISYRLTDQWDVLTSFLE